jgi:hypothetical protein
LRRLRRQEVPRRSRLGKTLGLVFAVLVLVLAAGVTFTIGWRPFIGPRARALTARKFGSTPARLARGEYLVRDVTNCMACHAEHDWTAHDAPILPNTLGANQDMNFLKGLPERCMRRIPLQIQKPGWETGATINWHAPSGRASPRWAGAVSVHAVPGFPIHVRRRPGLGHPVEWSATLT